MKFFTKYGFYILNLVVAIAILITIGIVILNRLDEYTNHGETIEVPSLINETLEDATQLIERNKLELQIIDSSYNQKMNPGCIVEQYPAPGSTVKENRTIQVYINMLSPEKIVFPNLKNSAFRQAVRSIEDLGLRFGRIIYEPSEFKNLVLGFKCHGQTIAPNDLVSKGSVVDIILGLGSSENRTTTPKLMGLTYANAAYLLRSTYLNVDSIFIDETITDSEHLNKTYIYFQEPLPNTTLGVGNGVKLYLTNSLELVAHYDSLYFNIPSTEEDYDTED